MEQIEQEHAQSLAIELGRKTYRTSRPCNHGHAERRFTSSGDCVSCYVIEKNRYQYEQDKEAIVRAQINNKPTYSSIIPCPKGHCGYRFTDTHKCQHCYKDWKKAVKQT